MAGKFKKCKTHSTKFKGKPYKEDKRKFNKSNNVWSKKNLPLHSSKPTHSNYDERTEDFEHELHVNQVDQLLGTFTGSENTMNSVSQAAYDSDDSDETESESEEHTHSPRPR